MPVIAAGRRLTGNLGDMFTVPRRAALALIPSAVLAGGLTAVAGAG